MVLVLSSVAIVLCTTTLVLVYFARRPPVHEPSPRPKRDDQVAVLEGGSGRGWT